MSVNNSKSTSKTDWAALETMSDDDIDYSDIPTLTEEFFKNATLRIPASQAHNWVNLELEIVRCFQAKGADYKGLINEALRRYIADKNNQNEDKA